MKTKRLDTTNILQSRKREKLFTKLPAKEALKLETGTAQCQKKFGIKT